MNSTTTKLLESLIKNEEKDISQYNGMKLSNFVYENKENLSLIALKNVLFFNNDEFSYEKIFTERKNCEWLNKLLKSFFKNCLEEEGNIKKEYEYFNRLFSLHYDEISQKYFEFLKTLKQMKKEIDYDLFGCLISFLSFINGNKEYRKLLENIGKNQIITLLKSNYEKEREKSLWYILTDYCTINHIPVLYKYSKSEIDPKKFFIDISELKCFVDLCKSNTSFEKFIQTIYNFVKDSRDTKNNKPAKLQRFIEEIFIMLNICLENCESWDDRFLYSAYDEIYKMAFNYTSDNFDENYTDFVVHYKVKYNLNNGDFFHLFFNGLIKENFCETFSNLQLKENINIIDEKNIKILINKFSKRKNSKKKKNKKVNEIPKEKINNNEINEIKQSESSLSKTESTNDKKGQPTKGEKKEQQQLSSINESDNSFESLKKKIIEMNIKFNIELDNMKNEMREKNEESETKIEELQSEIEELKSENEELKSEIEELQSENIKQDIKITKLSQDIKEMKKSLVKK